MLVWPNIGLTVYAEDLVTQIPDTSADVPNTKYYRDLKAAFALLDYDPLELSGDPIAVPAITRISAGLVGQLTLGLSSRPGLSDGESVITSGFAAAGDRGGDEYKFFAGASGGQINGTDFGRIDCPNGQYRLQYKQNTVRASSFGAGLGLGSDGDRLRAACLTLASTGGVVELGPGTFTLSNNSFVALLLADNVTVRGAGMDVTKLVLPGTWSPAIHFQGNSRCAVEDLTIELQAFVDFITAINANAATDCAVRRCRIYMTDAAAASATLGESTLHAVLAQGGTRLIVEDCEIRNMQLKMAGDSGGDGCWVRRNRIEKPLNYAVSYVAADSVAVPDPILNRCYIEDNVIKDSWSGGAIYVGPDGEQFSVAEMDTIHILRNTIYGSVESIPDGEHFGILLRTARYSRDFRVCGNTIINDEGTYDGSYGIRVQSVDTTDDVDGLDVSDNYVDGADHAGVWINVTGRNIRASRNVLKRCRGLYLVADHGDIHDALVSENECDATVIYGLRFVTDSGSIYGLTVANNKVCDVNGSGSGAAGNAGYHYEATSGRRIEATSRGNTARNKSRTDMGYGAWMYGQGTVDVHFEGDRFYDLHTGFLKRVIGPASDELAAGFATGRGNHGVGTVPCTREVTIRLSDVSTASSASVKSPCAGKIIGRRGYLGGPITGANSVITAALQPAAGGGYTNITGTLTVVASGSARGSRFQSVPSANNTVERAGDIQISTDGASSTAAVYDETLIIQEDV